MDARVRYASSADGTQIATWSHGSGPPLLMAATAGGLWPASSLAEIGGWRDLIDLLAAQHTVILYDPRGGGLSQRDATSFSLDDLTDDLASVADAHGLDRFALYGWRGAARNAVCFAERAPDRVSCLILTNPILRRRDQVLLPRDQAMSSLIESDFDFYVEAMALSVGGWELGARLAAQCRQATTKDAFLAAWRTPGGDVWDLLPSIACPTLVIHASDEGNTTKMPFDIPRRVTAAIPNATLASANAEVFGGRELAPVMLRFLAENDVASASAAGAPQPSGLAVLMFADIAGSTALTEQLGDRVFRDRAKTLDDALRAAIGAGGGRAVEGKLLGDGVLAVFGSARDAIDAARESIVGAAAAGLPLHVGLHAGDVISEAGNVYGGTVNIAARVSDAAPAGSVFVTATVRDLARTSADVTFDDRGDHALKGIKDAVRLYELRWRE
jgi:class 3 adenylate cyclase/pimeloyl-ACP methyl ester carboxylesterase